MVCSNVFVCLIICLFVCLWGVRPISSTCTSWIYENLLLSPCLFKVEGQEKDLEHEQGQMASLKER